MARHDPSDAPDTAESTSEHPPDPATATGEHSSDPATSATEHSPEQSSSTRLEGDTVTGIEYERLVSEFGAEPLSDEQIERFPDHPAIRRRTMYAGRDVDRYLDAADTGQPHAIVTGVGPSGPLHLGHVLPLYLAKRFQDETGATVYLPFSDDEKLLSRDLTFDEIGEYTRDNLRDVLAVGFDPERTRIVLDIADADVIYPLAVSLAERLTPATVDAVYGEQDNVGLSFYPAVQATHLLLPQLVEGQQPTLVPIAVDQDPHVRVCRDLAARESLPVEKPGALLGRFLPALDGPGKLSSSDDAPSIELTDDRETVAKTIREHAYTGGQSTVEKHRERGGDPSVDVPFQYLRYLFEPNDVELERIERAYRAGELLSGELKELAIDRIADFLADHQRRREALGPLADELGPYRLRPGERARALERVGVPRHRSTSLHREDRE
ncbi:tryptophanyl-tRNA synthetase [Halovivax asiaticus JCM 14624]|uniref:Tryptophan--tRNA ligase n=1 Tax=Halovivax asiaticus JCM 14624 TaxID=1227490 RepID=M0BGY2_9EURY|nr:tryptophan--tRNA ligase [Halovivax asiaticus]ELZ10105.1 tryptophanyl-tRNA synthetase [Halovivax asiaticus JCM 14624]